MKKTIENAIRTHPRKLGIVKVSVVMACKGMIEAFHALQFLPITAEYKVVEQIIEYVGYCEYFENVPIGNTLPDKLSNQKSFLYSLSIFALTLSLFCSAVGVTRSPYP